MYCSFFLMEKLLHAVLTLFRRDEMTALQWVITTRLALAGGVAYIQCSGYILHTEVMCAGRNKGIGQYHCYAASCVACMVNRRSIS